MAGGGGGEGEETASVPSSLDKGQDTNAVNIID